jgi:hypothetical protein
VERSLTEDHDVQRLTWQPLALDHDGKRSPKVVLKDHKIIFSAIIFGKLLEECTQ